ncbi:MAG: FAD-dependent oxidoreductase [Novosphingobium sp.]
MALYFDIAIAGVGIAGASLAAALVGSGARVLLLEAEAQPGYHATGRSAAFWTESYGGPGVQPLTTASGPALRDGGYLSPRGALTIARQGSEGELERFARRYEALGVRVERLQRRALEQRLPGLLPAWVGGVFEPDCSDIDVARLHGDCIAVAKRGGAELWCSARLVAGVSDGQGWLLTCADGRTARAGLLVNAAGAWADDLAEIAGVARLGLTPYRRTVAQVRTAIAPPPDLPLVLDLGESFYFKPEAGRLWLSPHDEVPTVPCDAAPEELAVAEAIERFDSVVNWQVERVEHRWAGLRTFAPDRLPVFGFDRHSPRFFWFAGQGGFGIQTAPASADLAARLIAARSPGAVDPRPYSPHRFKSIQPL